MRRVPTPRPGSEPLTERGRLLLAAVQQRASDLDQQLRLIWTQARAVGASSADMADVRSRLIREAGGRELECRG